jgi:MYXO-CTERM domain-containing protein
MDMDGSGADLDCDDSDPARYPLALDICGDGVDQDCDGEDADCTTGLVDPDPLPPDVEEEEPPPEEEDPVVPRGGGLSSGGCACRSGDGGGCALGLLLLIALAWLRRRRIGHERPLLAADPRPRLPGLRT